MNVTLSTDLQDYVATQVRSGHCDSESDVISKALNFQRRKTFEEQIDKRIEASHRQIASGDTILADDAFFERKIAMIQEKYINKAE